MGKACYPDLMAQYEDPIEDAYDVQEGQVWISVDGGQPGQPPGGHTGRPY